MRRGSHEYGSIFYESDFAAAVADLCASAVRADRARRNLARLRRRVEACVQTTDRLSRSYPEEKFSWRPAAGVRSTSEVYMHIALANFYLLSVTGPKMPAELKSEMEKSVTAKTDVINWLKRSLAAVKEAHASITAKDLDRKVHIADRDATVDGMYLRLVVHANEHMGQLIAYARMSGVTPPWSKQE